MSVPLATLLVALTALGSTTPAPKSAPSAKALGPELAATAFAREEPSAASVHFAKPR